jgi:hypothetical protein
VAEPASCARGTGATCDTVVLVELLVQGRNLDSLYVGQRALVLFTEPKATFPAEVQSIVPIKASRGGATVTLGVREVPRSFAPEQRVTARVNVGFIPDALVLDSRFMNWRTSDTSVFLLSKNRATHQRVGVEEIGNGLLVVRSGAVAGDTVVTGSGLRNGDRVTVQSLFTPDPQM